MNVVTIKINGIEYNIKGEESENYIMKVSDLVNSTINNIKKKNHLLSAVDVTALASIRIADEFLKGLEEKEVIQCQARDIFEKNAALHDELKKARRAFEELSEEMKSLEEKNEKLSNEEHVLDYEKEIASLKSQLSIMEEKSREYIKENSDIKEQCEKIKVELQNEKEASSELKNKNNQINKKLIRMENELVDSNIALAKTLQLQSRRNK